MGRRAVNGPFTILVDLDQVMTDFEGGLERAMRHQHPECPLMPYEQRTVGFSNHEPEHQSFGYIIRQIVDTPGFYIHLEPMPGALEALAALHARGHWIHLVSSPLYNGHCAGEKLLWVQRHLGNPWLNQVVLTWDKSRVRGHVLVDDWAEPVNAARAEWSQIVFDQPYNRQVVTRWRLKGWEPVGDAIQIIEDCAAMVEWMPNKLHRFP